MTPLISWPIFLSLWSLGCLIVGMIFGAQIAVVAWREERNRAERAENYAIRLLTDEAYWIDQRSLLSDAAVSVVVGLDVSEVHQG